MEELITVKNARTLQGERVRLGYYLLSDRDGGHAVKVLLRRANGVVEECATARLACSKAAVLELIEALSHGSVIPITNDETVWDYLVSQGLCV